MRLRSMSFAILIVCLASVAARAEALPVSTSETVDPAERCERVANTPTTRASTAHETTAHERSASLEPAVVSEPATEPPGKSLVARQGLLVPAAFLAAASALSSLLVYAVRGRSLASPARDVTPAAHGPAPAAH